MLSVVVTVDGADTAVTREQRESVYLLLGECYKDMGQVQQAIHVRHW